MQKVERGGYPSVGTARTPDSKFALHLPVGSLHRSQSSGCPVPSLRALRCLPLAANSLTGVYCPRAYDHSNKSSAARPWLALAAIPALLSTGIALPQNDSGSRTFRSATRVVNLNVVVTDTKGHPVTDLTKDDFII